MPTPTHPQNGAHKGVLHLHWPWYCPHPTSPPRLLPERAQLHKRHAPWHHVTPTPALGIHATYMPICCLPHLLPERAGLRPLPPPPPGLALRAGLGPLPLGLPSRSPLLPLLRLRLSRRRSAWGLRLRLASPPRRLSGVRLLALGMAGGWAGGGGRVHMSQGWAAGRQVICTGSP
jgi:hypothetical protein